MRYQGGKYRIATKLAAAIRSRCSDAIIYEPFCGGGAMTWALAKAGFRVAASDNHEDLILMWQAVMRGETEVWADVSEAEHKALKSTAPSARRGFVGFGASFGGEFFHSFAKHNGTGAGYQNRLTDKTSTCNEAQRSVERLAALRSVLSFTLADYTATPDHVAAYCDPPYKGTKPYKGQKPFDHDAFWAWVRQRSGLTFVSELTGPDDLEVIWCKPYVAKHSASLITREERLYYKPATISAHDRDDAAGVPGHDAAAHHADHGLHEPDQSAAGLPAQRAEGEPSAAGAGGAVDAREQYFSRGQVTGSDH